MANTVTWLGGLSTHTDPNDATDALNWTPVPPSFGDTVEILAGTAGAGVTLDLFGTVGSVADVLGTTVNMAGQYDTINFGTVALADDIFTAGSGTSAGHGLTLNITNATFDTTGATSFALTAGDYAAVSIAGSNLTGVSIAAGDNAVVSLNNSAIDTFDLTVGNHATLNLTGTLANSAVISSSTGNSSIRQTGSGDTLQINVFGTVSSDATTFLSTAGGQTTISIGQTVNNGTTVAGFYDITSALVNIGGTVTVNGDANRGTRFSNNAYSLIAAVGAPAVDVLNARMNGIAGEFNIMGAFGGTLDVNTNVPGGQIIDFGDATGVLKIETGTVLPFTSTVNNGTTTVAATTVIQNFFGRINGFKPGDTIDLVGLNPAGLTYSYGNDATYGSSVLTISSGSTVEARLRIGGDYVVGAGTVDGASTGNFKLTSSGGNTLVTIANTQTLVSGAQTIAVTGSIALWNGVTNGATTDWSAANWSGGTAGGLPGQYQNTQITLTENEAASVVTSGNLTNYVLTVNAAETAGSVEFDDPSAQLLIAAPLTVARLPGQPTGGGFNDNSGRVEIAAGGTLTAAHLLSSANAQVAIDAGGMLAISGVPSFAFGGGLSGIEIANNLQDYGGTIVSTGNMAIGQNNLASVTIANSNPVFSNTGNTYGGVGASVSVSYTQVGANVLVGANLGNGNSGNNGPFGSNLQIAGPNTAYTDAGGDASTPFSGAMIVGGGNLTVNALGQVGFQSGGAGYVNVQDGATLTDASFAMIGAGSGGAFGAVNLNNGAVWNIGLGNGNPGGSIVVGNTITGSATLWSGGLPWLTVGGGSAGSLSVNSSVVQLGTGELFNNFKMMIGGGSSSNSTAVGNVFVQGIGATLDTGGGPMVVGQRSAGRLEIGNGGVVSVGAAAATTDIAAGLMIGNRSGTAGIFTGQVVVDGGGLLTDAGDLVIGRDSQGTLTVNGLGTVTATGGLYLGGFLSMNDGTTSIAPTLARGQNTSGNHLDLFGGTVAATAGTLDIWQGSTINLNGGSELTIGVGSAVSGDLVVAAGARLQGAGLLAFNGGGNTLLNNGTVIAGGLVGQTNTVLEVNGNVAGSGTFDIKPAGTLQLDGSSVISAIFDFGLGNFSGGQLAEVRALNPVAFQGTVDNLYSSFNKIDLVGATLSGVNPLTYTPNSDVTTGGTVGINTSLGTVHFRVTGYHPLGFATAPDGGTGTVVFGNDTAPCFVAGTRILTVAGERAAEALRPGDVVPVADGGPMRRVVWVGSTRIDLGRHREPEKVAPVRVMADAFAPGAPVRDLMVSPDHAIWTGEALIPAYLLVNGRTIVRMPAGTCQQ